MNEDAVSPAEQGRHDMAAARFSIRVRYRPRSRLEVHVGPSGKRQLAAPLRREQEQSSDVSEALGQAGPRVGEVGPQLVV